MDDLLFITHRIPYPPNKGDKIRSFHLLEYLSRRYRIHLGTFIDSPTDLQYRDAVQTYCASAWIGRLSPRRAKLKSLRGLLTGEALTACYYQRADLKRWIHDLCGRHAIGRALVYSSGVAPYLLGPAFSRMRRVVDFVDVDSDKWRQYSATRPFPLSWIYRREASRLADLECQVARQFDASLLVSESEASLFRQRCGSAQDSVLAMSNGVDSEYFSPNPARPSPFEGEGQRLVFTGAMDYWANEEGASWLVREVLPRIQRLRPGVELYLVGMNPSAGVRRLGQAPGVHVTGGVPDVRPYLQHANLVVAPLRIARGIQNKVLEAMSMARPVVTTPQALEGISAKPGQDLLVAQDAQELADQVLYLLEEGGEAIGRSARALVQRDFSWENNLPRVVSLLEGAP